jgi:PKD repeat protein
MIVNYTFNDPGNYVVTLTVKNLLGDVGRDTVNIEVLPREIHVDDMSISLISGSDNSVKAQVVVEITDDKGEPVADVMVRGKWSGLLKGQTVGVTDASRKAVFVSDSTSKEGKIKFKVKNARTAGCTFIQGNNSIRISTDVQSNLAPVVNIASDICAARPRLTSGLAACNV